MKRTGTEIKYLFTFQKRKRERKRQKEKEVFYLIMLSTATVIYCQWHINEISTKHWRNASKLVYLKASELFMYSIIHLISDRPLLNWYHV